MRFVHWVTLSGITRAAAILSGALVVLGGPRMTCAQMPKQLVGCWQTTRTLHTSNLQSLSPAEARTFLGRKLRFSESLARSGDTVLQSPQYYVRRVSASDFADAFTITLKDIGITENSAVEVDIYRGKNQLTEFPGNLVLLKDKRTILWNWRGIFFEARRCTAPSLPATAKRTTRPSAVKQQNKARVVP